MSHFNVRTRIELGDTVRYADDFLASIFERAASGLRKRVGKVVEVQAALRAGGPYVCMVEWKESSRHKHVEPAKGALSCNLEIVE